MQVSAPQKQRSAPTGARFAAARLAAAAYALVSVAAAAHHERWADEAQSWLLARDASLAALWTRLLHYEGTPGLWQTALWAITRLGVPYAGLSVFAALLGLAAAWLMARHSPLPAAVRLALPFTYFLCYQYAVVARSYTLLPLLLFGCAVLYRNALERLVPFTVLLCLLAAVSVHGFLLSASILAAFLAEHARLHWRRLAVPVAVWSLAALAVAWSAWPAGDAVFVTRLNFSAEHFWSTGGKMFREAFTGNLALSLAAVAASLPFLWKGRGLLVFALSAALLCGVSSVVYAQVWHYGILLLAWIFALWIAAYRLRPGPMALAAMTLVIVPQCYWSVRSVEYDWNHAYSGSLEAARYLRGAGIPPERLYAIGYATTGLQPYFESNIFGNVNGGAPRPAYWDWSVRNRVNQSGGRLASLRPEYVLVGFKGDYERDLWTRQVTEGGYFLVRRFNGHLFWRTRVLEPETYDLYRRTLP